MQSILCISLNPAIDISCDAESVKPTVKTRTFNQIHHPGGCAVNVARVIASFGGQPELVYLAGGATGAFLSDCLDILPIKQHHIAAAGPTRISYTVHDQESGLEYRFVPKGAAVQEDEIADLLDRIERLDAGYIVASGSLPPNVPDDIYVRIADIAARKNARVILDSSGAALKTALDAGGIYLTKPNLVELEQLLGKKLDRHSAGAEARALVEAGKAENIVISMGEAGAVLVNAEGMIDIAAPKITARSTVGAGDSFVGAISFALASDVDVAEAFHLAVAAGSAAVMTPGTELCHRGDVLKLYRQGAERRNMEGDAQFLALSQAIED